MFSTSSAAEGVKIRAKHIKHECLILHNILKHVWYYYKRLSAKCTLQFVRCVIRLPDCLSTRFENQNIMDTLNAMKITMTNIY